ITAGRIPSFASVKPKTALSAATTMSQTAARPAPPPSAAPWTRPTSGTGSMSSARNIADIARASRTFSSCEYATIFDIQVRSAPAENTFPSPRSTATRTPGGSGARAHAARSPTRCSSKAFRASGRLRETATPGPAIEIVSALIRERLHPEDAEPRPRDRRVQRSRQSQREGLPRLRRIEDDVVPETRGRVVGRTFALVLLDDRDSNGLFLLRSQLEPFPRKLIALD